jgi:hypothetical protein
MGLAETHQTLVLNGLRSRVALQVDGGCAPAATSSSARCSALTNSASRPRR